MSGGQACQCSEKREPLTVPEGSNRPGRLWRVSQRLCNHSAFNGYHCTSSDYSSVVCIRCGACWRTKAPYVSALPDLDWDTEGQISYGIEGHQTAMAARGREPLR